VDLTKAKTYFAQYLTQMLVTIIAVIERGVNENPKKLVFYCFAEFSSPPP
jgi:hypothetical protein